VQNSQKPVIGMNRFAASIGMTSEILLAACVIVLLVVMLFLVALFLIALLVVTAASRLSMCCCCCCCCSRGRKEASTPPVATPESTDGIRRMLVDSRRFCISPAFATRFRRQGALLLAASFLRIIVLSCYPFCLLGSFTLAMRPSSRVHAGIVFLAVLCTLVPPLVAGGAYMKIQHTMRTRPLEYASDVSFMRSFGTLVSDFRPYGERFFVFSVVHKVVTGCVIGFAHEEPVIQLAVLMLVHGGYLVLLVRYLPYQSQLLNAVSGVVIVLRLGITLLSLMCSERVGVSSEAVRSLSVACVILNSVAMCIVVCLFVRNLLRKCVSKVVRRKSRALSNLTSCDGVDVSGVELQVVTVASDDAAVEKDVAGLDGGDCRIESVGGVSDDDDDKDGGDVGDDDEDDDDDDENDDDDDGACW